MTILFRVSLAEAEPIRREPAAALDRDVDTTARSVIEITYEAVA